MRLLALTTVLFAFAACHGMPGGPAAERRFLEVDGPVTCDGKPAVVGMEIGTKAHIDTAEGGRALITVQAGSVIEVREHSRLALNPSKRHKTSVQLLEGILWSILPPGKADYEVVTNNAVAGVRGTTFFLDATHPDEQLLCLCQGEVDLQAGPGQQDLHTGANEHTGYRIAGKSGAATVERMGTLPDAPNHPNARREQLRALAPK